MRGPAPKPTALKIIQGNPGGKRLNENEPKPKVVCPPAPSFLDAEAKKEWRRVAKMLSKNRILTEADIPALQMYVVEYSTWKEAVENLNRDDIIYETDNKYKQQSIWLTIRNRSFDNLRKMLQEFGMTPASRSRIAAVGEDKQKSSFAAL